MGHHVFCVSFYLRTTNCLISEFSQCKFEKIMCFSSLHSTPSLSLSFCFSYSIALQNKCQNWSTGENLEKSLCVSLSLEYVVSWNRLVYFSCVRSSFIKPIASHTRHPNTDKLRELHGLEFQKIYRML